MCTTWLISLKEECLHALVLKNIVIFKRAVLLHLNELIEVNTIDTGITLLLKAEVMESVANALGASGSRSFTIRLTEGDHCVDISLFQVEWVEGAWEISCWCDDVSEGDVWVGELSSEETVHARVVAGDFEVSPEHVD